MNVISIPSILQETGQITLKLNERNDSKTTWAVELECHTFSLSAKLKGQLVNNDVIFFIKELENVEKKRVGSCQLADEWGFSITIRSIDSLGHFVVEVAIWSQGKTHGEEGRLGDSLNIAYEIEPSLLTSLLNDFKNLYK